VSRWIITVLLAASTVASGATPAAAAAATTAPTAISNPAQFALRSELTAPPSAVGTLQRVLPTRTVHQVLVTANHDRGPLCHAAPADAVTGFCWTATDDGDCHNVPQGLTTSRDAVGGYGSVTDYGSPGHQLIVVSWRYRTSCTADVDTRSRITLVDWDATWTPDAYRKVLLVEPTTLAIGVSQVQSFSDIPIHAGGTFWVGNYLFVADTGNGLRVFDMTRILEVDTGGADSAIGYQSPGLYRAHNYRYVLPQVGRVVDVGTQLRWSTVGLDRATSPMSFVVAEYQSSGTPQARAVRFPVNGNGTLPTTGGLLHASQALKINHNGINGVVSHNGRWWFAQSAGGGNPNLFYWTPSMSTATAYPWVGSPESLSYWESSTGPDLLWNLREGTGNRNVFAVEQRDYS
jgi:hypothetical protein